MATGGTNERNLSQFSQKTPEHEELGMIYDKPKYPKLAKVSKRQETLKNCSASLLINEEKLADAGFFKRSDNKTYCHYCGGGLENWIKGDDPRIEHARHYPRCGHLKLRFGQDFIDAVQKIKKCDTTVQITVEMVQRELGGPIQDVTKESLKHDPAVKAVSGHAYSESDVIEAANTVLKAERPLSSEVLLQQLHQTDCEPFDDQESQFSSSDTDGIQDLRRENDQLRKKLTCKVCKQRESSVVFIPCAHLVCCLECSTGLEKCPVQTCCEDIHARHNARLPTLQVQA